MQVFQTIVLGGHTSLGNQWLQSVVGLVDKPTNLPPQQRFGIDCLEIIHMAHHSRAMGLAHGRGVDARESGTRVPVCVYGGGTRAAASHAPTCRASGVPAGDADWPAF